LVSVEDVGRAVPDDRFLDNFKAEVDGHVDRDSPLEHPTAEPIEHHGEVERSPAPSGCT
jgi:hypothetical protein